MLGTFGLVSVAATKTSADSMALEGSVARAGSRAQEAIQRIKALEANLAKTMMICETLWELLQEKTGLTIDDLHNKLYEVDMRDGVLDGKNQRQASKCPSCHHMVSPRHPACIYCGRVMDESVFSMD